MTFNINDSSVNISIAVLNAWEIISVMSYFFSVRIRLIHLLISFYSIEPLVIWTWHKSKAVTESSCKKPFLLFVRDVSIAAAQKVEVIFQNDDTNFLVFLLYESWKHGIVTLELYHVTFKMRIHMLNLSRGSRYVG